MRHDRHRRRRARRRPSRIFSGRLASIEMSVDGVTWVPLVPPDCECLLCDGMRRVNKSWADAEIVSVEWI